MSRPIFFLTDFGLADTYVGVVKAVMLGIAPDARIVDLTHDVPPQDIRAGAFALMTAAPYLPDDAVVLAVVDPGVGTARRPIAVQAAGRTYVGPDNGLLSWAVRRSPTPCPPPHCGGEGEPTSECDGEGEPIRDLPGGLPSPSQWGGAGGGAFSAVVLDRPGFWRPNVSATFHGRDLFGPVAAHLARGVALQDVGSPCGPMQELPFPEPRLVYASARADQGQPIVEAHGAVIHVDRFGNLITNLTATDLPDGPQIEVAGRSIRGLAPHFQPASDSGDSTEGVRLVALIGSSGLLEVAVPNGSAAAALGAGIGTTVTVRATGA